MRSRNVDGLRLIRTPLHSKTEVDSDITSEETTVGRELQPQLDIDGAAGFKEG